jgi:predicted ATP-dependent endonuclease of OLD family
MLIERVQIEEGFLDGLDVNLVKGLNVVIGERGTGKTSLIELIRFCLRVDGYTPESTKRSRDHALSVLGSGRVTVTLLDGNKQMLVSRTAADEPQQFSVKHVNPIILSQTEIENVGLQAHGRLRLLDSFIGDRKEAEESESGEVSRVRSFTAEVEALRREIDDLNRKAGEIPALDKLIADLAPKEQDLAKVSSDAKIRKDNLDLISNDISETAVAIGAVQRFQQSVSTWITSVSRLISESPTIELWPESAGADLLENSRASIRSTIKQLEEARLNIQRIEADAHSKLNMLSASKYKLEDQARQYRKEIDALQDGAGEIMRQGQQLRERKAQLESLKNVLEDRNASLGRLLTERATSLDKLDKIRESRFNVRHEIANRLSETLGPRIRVNAYRAGQFESFAAAIADTLRGSGLRYNELASLIAQYVSPRELLEAIDSNDFEFISEATGVAKDRSVRALGQLRESDIGTLATASVEDSVSFQLLDGAIYKDISQLSMGQRCTVILPLVLRHTNRILIVDQPEDHIDNAFIADTLIVSLLARDPNSQIIFSTHNANIPVLGNAQNIVQLGSDGKRGFPVLQSDLDDPAVVQAISTLMEGGAQAFEQRSRFYRNHTTS